jgi:predicted N-acyltransferase
MIADALDRGRLPAPHDQQFHFFNEGYASYDDFLATLASRKRKALKKERREALAEGISDRAADRQRHHRSRLGRLLRLLHGHRRPQMGPALSQPASSSR